MHINNVSSENDFYFLDILTPLQTGRENRIYLDMQKNAWVSIFNSLIPARKNTVQGCECIYNIFIN